MILGRGYVCAKRFFNLSLLCSSLYLVFSEHEQAMVKFSRVSKKKDSEKVVVHYILLSNTHTHTHTLISESMETHNWNA